MVTLRRGHVGTPLIQRTDDSVFETVFLFDKRDSRELYLGRLNILASCAVLIRSCGSVTHILFMMSINDLTVGDIVPQ